MHGRSAVFPRHGRAGPQRGPRLAFGLIRPLMSRETLSGHTHAPLERLRTQEVVWLGQDTTLLPYGTTPPKAGRGTVKITTREASLRHPPVAFTPARVHGGVGEMQGHLRQDKL